MARNVNANPLGSPVASPDWAGHQMPSVVSKEYMEFMSQQMPDIKVLERAWKDDVMRARGIGIVQDMLADARVSQGSDLKKSAVISVGFDTLIDNHIVKDRKMQDKLKRFVDQLFRGVRGSQFEFLKDILSAFDYGYSFNIMTWKTITSGEFKGLWALDYITPLAPSLYKLKFNDAGHADHLESNMYMSRGFGGGKELDAQAKRVPMSRVIYMKLGSNFGSPYGRSQITKVFEAYWNKRILRRMRNSAMDRFGTPFMVGKVAPNTTEERRRKLLNALINMSIESVAVIDNNETIEAVQTGGLAGVNSFQEQIRDEDKEIIAGIVGASLNVMEGGSQGSYAQARVHQDNFLYSVQEIVSILEDVINEQFIKRLITANFGEEIAEGVRVKWRDASDPQVEVFLARYQAIGRDLMDPTDPRERKWARDFLSMPEQPKKPIDDGKGNLIDPDTKEIIKTAWELQAEGITLPSSTPPEGEGMLAEQGGGAAPQTAAPQPAQETSETQEIPWWLQDDSTQVYAPPARSYAGAPQNNKFRNRQPMTLKKKAATYARR